MCDGDSVKMTPTFSSPHTVPFCSGARGGVSERLRSGARRPPNERYAESGRCLLPESAPSGLYTGTPRTDGAPRGGREAAAIERRKVRLVSGGGSPARGGAKQAWWEKRKLGKDRGVGGGGKVGRGSLLLSGQMGTAQGAAGERGEAGGDRGKVLEARCSR